MKHSAMDLCEYELEEQVSAAGKLSLKTRDTNTFKSQRGHRNVSRTGPLGRWLSLPLADVNFGVNYLHFIHFNVRTAGERT